MRRNAGPSFFKLLLTSDFTRLLRLPDMLVSKYGSIFPRKVKLRMNSGRTWEVKVEAMEEEEDGSFCFSRGWTNFAKDVGLDYAQFLLFTLDDNDHGCTTFDVSVYENNGCIKEFLDDDEQECNIIKQNADGGKKRHQTTYGCSSSTCLEESGSPLYFEIVLTQYNLSRINLRKSFWMAAGLQGKKSVGLEFGPTNHYQRVKLVHKPKRGVDMAKGWHHFCKANNLVVGKKYSFKFKPSKSLILVHEV